MAQWLRVPPQQLRYGAEIETQLKQQRVRVELALGYQDREMIEAYLRIPPPQRKALREMILGVARAYPAESG